MIPDPFERYSEAERQGYEVGRRRVEESTHFRFLRWYLFALALFAVICALAIFAAKTASERDEARDAAARYYEYPCPKVVYVDKTSTHYGIGDPSPPIPEKGVDAVISDKVDGLGYAGSGEIRTHP